MKTDVRYVPRLEMFFRQIGGGAAAQNIIFHEINVPCCHNLSAAHPKKSRAAISLSVACLADKNNENIEGRKLILLESVDK
jgi:hypothetical protein